MILLNKKTNQKITVDPKMYPSATYADYTAVPSSLENKDIIWDEKTQKVIEKPASKLDILTALYLTFPLAWQYQFKPLKDAVIAEFDNLSNEELAELINGFILPPELEQLGVKQQFINVLNQV